MASVGVGIKRKTDQDSKYEKKKRKKSYTLNGSDGLRPKNCPLSERQQLALVMQLSAEQSSAAPSSPIAKKTPGNSSKKDKVNKINTRGETALHLATIKGDLSQIKDLISKGADINSSDYAGWTPLHEACNRGYRDIAEFLLLAGARVNPKGYRDDYPLHDAVNNNHIEVVKLLMMHGANPQLANSDGLRPLDIKMPKKMKKILMGEWSSKQQSPAPPQPHHHQQQQQRHYNSKPKEFDSKQQKLDCQLSSSHKRIKKHKSKGEDRNKSDPVGNSSGGSSSRKQLYSNNNNGGGGGAAASSSSTTFSSPPYSNDDFSKSSSDLEEDEDGRVEMASVLKATTTTNGCRANKENNSSGGVSSKLTAVAQATAKNNNIHSDISEISDDDDDDDDKISSSSSSESSASASSSDEMYNSTSHKKCGKKWMREELMSSYTTSRTPAATISSSNNNGKSLMMKSGNHDGGRGKLTSGGLLSFESGGGKSLLSDHYGSPPSTPDVYEFSPGEEDSPNKLATIMLRNGVKQQQQSAAAGKQRDHVTNHHHHHHHHPTTIKSAIDRPPIVSFAYDDKQSGKLEAASGGKWSKKKNKRSSSKDSGSDSTTSSSASFVLSNKNNNFAKLNGLFAESNGGGKIYSSPTPFLAMHHEKMLKSAAPVVVPAKRNAESPSLNLDHHHHNQQQQQRTKPKHVNEMETVMNSANHRTATAFTNNSVKLKEKLSKSCSDPTAKSKPGGKECRKPSASATVVAAVKSPVSINNHHHHQNGTAEPQTTTTTPNNCKKSVSLLDTPLEFLSDFDTPNQKRVKKKKKSTSSHHKHQRPTATVTLSSPSSSSNNNTPQKAAVRLSESTPWFLTAVKQSTPDHGRTKAAMPAAARSCNAKRTARSVSLNTPGKKLPDSCTTARLLSDNQLLDAGDSNSSIDTALSIITAENNSTAVPTPVYNHHHQQQRDVSDGESVRTTAAVEEFAPAFSNGSRDAIVPNAVEAGAGETKVEALVKTEPQTATATTAEEEAAREEAVTTDAAPTITASVKVEGGDDDGDDKSVDDASAADVQPTCATAADVEVVENGDQAATQLQLKQEKAETAADDDDADDDRDDDDESDNDEELSERALREQRQKEEDSYKARIEKEKNEYQMLLNEYLLQKHSAPAVLVERPTPLPVYFPPSTLMHKKIGHHHHHRHRSNSYADRFKIDQIVNEKRRRLTPIVSKAPDHFWEFLTFTGRYRLHGHKASELSIPLVNPPAHLDLPMRELFVMHEGARTRLRIRHVIEREKVVLSCEQEILRVHARAARTIHNQQIPYSACSYLLDAEVYKLPSLGGSLCGSAAVTAASTTTTAGDRRGAATQGENDNSSSKGSIRDRFNKRTFTSWMQDVVDKFAAVKSSMLARQKHEAAALLAVQRCEWSLKMRDIKITNNGGTDIPIDKIKDEVVDECCVPLVNIGDDFKLLPKTP